MPRSTSIPAAAPPDIATTRRADNGFTTLKLRFRLLTPLFGGGVKPGVNDPIRVIRGPSVRGQLRFWWRATRGGRYNSVQALKTAEGHLWGSASHTNGGGPSAVTLHVTIPQNGGGQPFQAVNTAGAPVNNVGMPQSRDSYVAFPLRGTPDATLREGVIFELTITLPTAWRGGTAELFAGTPAAEIEAALWAWATFGGIGARTRRGFGALQLTHRNGTAVVPPTVQDLRDSVLSGLQQHVVAGTWPTDVPHLTQQLQFKTTPAAPQSIAAWRNLIDRLKSFRQQRPRNNGNFGRSHWPEADELRRATRQYSHHAPTHPINSHPRRKFPRAQFGLPLILQFKNGAGDPTGTFTVEGVQQGTVLRRLASPLILRPIAVQNGTNVQYCGLAARLVGTRLPDQLTLSVGNQRLGEVTAALTNGDLAHIRSVAGAQPLLSSTDVIQSFFDRL